MARKIDWERLDNDQQFILSNYLEEMEPVMGMLKVRFTDRICTCCGQSGFVPEHHKFLCVFCYVSAPFFVENLTEPFKTENFAIRESDGKGIDKVNINIPIGIAGLPEEPNVYRTVKYSSKNMTQEELQALIP